MVNNNHCTKSKGKYPANALLVKSFKLQRISKRRPLFCQVQNFSSNQSFSAPAQWLLMSSLRKELKKSLHPYNCSVSHFARFNDESIKIHKPQKRWYNMFAIFCCFVLLKKRCALATNITRKKIYRVGPDVTNSWKFFRCTVGLANIALVQFCRSLEASTISKGTWWVHQRAIM